MPDAGRVIAGTARSIRLDAPGPGTRPFGDRVKQTLFAILEPDLRGAIVLDLFAGSGAAGIEALSRGATHTTFVERDAQAVSVIGTNLERTNLAAPAQATVTRSDVLAWLRDPARAHEPKPTLVILDPDKSGQQFAIGPDGALELLDGSGDSARRSPSTGWNG